MARFMIGLLLIVVLASPVQVLAQLEQDFAGVVIDGRRIPFDSEIQVEGVIEHAPDRPITVGVMSLIARRIDGKPYLHPFNVLLIPNEAERPSYNDLRRLKVDSYHKLCGRLTNAKLAGATNYLVVRVDRLEETPNRSVELGEFQDRTITFEGKALSGGKVQHQAEQLTLSGLTEWPERVVGKQIAVRGIVKQTESGWALEQPTWSQISLDELVGQYVDLEGDLVSLNGDWWFEYRDQPVYLVDAAGPRMRFASNLHASPARVQGTLIQQLRPSPGSYTNATDADLLPRFVIRAPIVKPNESSKTRRQRFGNVYASHHTLVEGVPLLIPHMALRPGLLGTETSLSLYYDRNFEAIDWILRHPSARTNDILTIQMNETSHPLAIRCIYAGLLATANDERGRQFLASQCRAREEDYEISALTCLSWLPFREDKDHLYSNDWSIDLMMELMNDPREMPIHGFVMHGIWTMPVNRAAEEYTGIPWRLAQSGNKRAEEFLRDYVLRQAEHVSESDDSEYGALTAFCRSGKPSVDDLLTLESKYKQPAARRIILRALLAAPQPQGLDRFAEDLGRDFVFQDVRDRLTPELFDHLRPLIPQATGDAKSQIQILEVLTRPDPAGELIKLLEDPSWTRKDLVIWELTRLKDPRAVAPLARVLREAPADYFGIQEDHPHRDSAINNAISAISGTGTHEAIQALIHLLPVDLSRFSTYTKPKDWPRKIAVELIDLTGESFGADQKAWQNWLNAHPDFHVSPDKLKSHSVFRTNAEGVIDFGR